MSLIYQFTWLIAYNFKAVLSTAAVVIKTTLKVFWVIPKKIKIVVSSKREREREKAKPVEDIF